MNNKSGNTKIKPFTDLNTRKEGHKLVIRVYEISKYFTKEETHPYWAI